ncbi:MAG: hypothetical protein LKF53_02180 [Solobacterium sp.]|jgi:hypothetical protein|nr:hypothetical protein [Solobacterium sp.]MCH4226779.1 hypothetical protein [Solobacterium sp.]MCH4281892.1 hypothetical protein [Solobacterium sp.]
MELAVIKDKVRVALRKSKLDIEMVDEINDCVDSTLEDLKRSGANVNLSDPLVLEACKMNGKATFGYESESEKYKSCYEQLKKQLGMYSPYKSDSNG